MSAAPLNFAAFRLAVFISLFSLAALAASAAPSGVYHIHRLSEQQLLRTYETILWDACAHSDQFWHCWNNQPEAGLWGSGRSDNMNEGIRAISEMVFTCAVVTKYSDTGTDAKRRDYKEKAKEALRYIVASHLSGPLKCTDGKPWGGSWQSAMWTATMGFGAWLMWDGLDAELQKGVEWVVASEADRFLASRPPSGSYGDTKAEENGWNLICLSLAANMFASHPHAPAWRQKAIEYMINTLSAPQDAHDDSVVDGRPVRAWFSGANLHPDFTLENHGFFHPAYVGCSSYFLTQAVMHYTFAHRPVPEAATHHLMDTWHMFESILLPDGESAYPQGMDWELHGLPYINLYASLATYQKDRFAAAMEQAFIQYMRQWQVMQKGDLAVPGSTLGFTRHAICAEQAAYGFLAHKLFGPAVKPLNRSAADNRADGINAHPDSQFITDRTPFEFVSFSWTNRVMGMLVPIGRGHEANPNFTVPMVNSLIGSFDLSPRGDTRNQVLSHTWHLDADGFTTTGALLLNGGRLRQSLRLISIGERTVVYEDRVIALTNVTVVAERGAPVWIENDAITGGTRSVFDASGEKDFNWQHPSPEAPLSGSFACVDGRLGVLALASSGLAYAQAARLTRGLCVYADALYGSFCGVQRTFRTGDEVARRVIIFYLETTPQQCRELSKRARLDRSATGGILTFKLPEKKDPVTLKLSTP